MTDKLYSSSESNKFYAEQTLLDIDNRWVKHSIGLSKLIKFVNVTETRQLITFTVAIFLDSCPKCGAKLQKDRDRNPSLTDIPLEGKPVKLEIKSYYYRCTNDECDGPDTFDLTHLAKPRSRSTNRLLEEVRRRGLMKPKDVADWAGLTINQVRRIRKTPFRLSTQRLPKVLGLMALRLDHKYRALFLYDAAGSPNDETYFYKVCGDYHREELPLQAIELVERIHDAWNELYSGERLLLVTQTWPRQRPQRIMSILNPNKKNEIKMVIDPFHVLRFAYAHTFRGLGSIAIRFKNTGAYKPLSALLASWSSFFSLHDTMPVEISSLLSQVDSTLHTNRLNKLYFSMQAALDLCNPNNPQPLIKGKLKRLQQLSGDMGKASEPWLRTTDTVDEWKGPLIDSITETRFHRDLVQQWYEYIHTVIYEKNGLIVQDGQSRDERLQEILKSAWLPNPMTNENRFRPAFWKRGSEFYTADVVASLRKNDTWDFEFDDFMKLPYMYGIDEDEVWNPEDAYIFRK
ncbi:transposase family protein [Alicyclobacillus sp. SO9]|uniref:transposase family protein n=1 Tax=Alicyclobacillus sp. SO9 TaxID=2665646 RepID=UPI0018E80D39|nr:transposase family protein [Alicyclobacillus sp. SO9]QQE80395.1 transposase family protein [Alicyclobacillus sp. SO9]